MNSDLESYDDGSDLSSDAGAARGVRLHIEPETDDEEVEQGDDLSPDENAMNVSSDVTPTGSVDSQEEEFILALQQELLGHQDSASPVDIDDTSEVVGDLQISASASSSDPAPVVQLVVGRRVVFVYPSGERAGQSRVVRINKIEGEFMQTYDEVVRAPRTYRIALMSAFTMLPAPAQRRRIR